MSEAVLNMEEEEMNRPKPKEPPRLLIGMSDVRVKIGTDIQFYAKGWFGALNDPNAKNCNLMIMYRVFHQLADLGLFDFELRSSASCLNLLRQIGFRQ